MSAVAAMLTAMPAPTPPPLGTVTLITGPAEFLSERAVARVLSAVAATDADADVTSISAGALGPGSMAELTSPSLFATAQTLVVRELPDLPEGVHDELVAYAAAPEADVALVLVHPGGPKGKRLLDRLRKEGLGHVVTSEPPKPWELPGFVTAEVRHHRGTITDDAAEYLVAAVGTDLRALAAAAEQLVNDFSPERLTIEIVRRYYDGHAEVKSFDIADAAIGGQIAVALERLRWAVGNGVPAVLITSAFASGLRSLARLQSAPRGLRDADLAREVGAPPFRLKALRGQLRSWDVSGLTRAIQAVAQADLDVKGGAGDPDYALERMVLTVAWARGRR